MPPRGGGSKRILPKVMFEILVSQIAKAKQKICVFPVTDRP